MLVEEIWNPYLQRRQHLTAKCFIKSQQTREKYQCGICYQVCVKPVKCKGPCGKFFCMKCVSDIRQKLDFCPNRCSKPFLVKKIPDIQLDFFCPYNSSQCHIPINTIKSFQNHYKECKYVSEDQLYLKKLQNSYKCLKAHHLQFFIGSYEQMVGSICTVCEEKQLCRSYCRQCDEFYCVNCRALPCSKEGCPIGHSFQFQRTTTINYICDICGVSTAVSNDGVYDDHYCNLGICQDCYSELPEKFDKSKPRELIVNISSQCSCGNILELYQCELCKRKKQCPKYCPNCHKRYCIACKLMYIDSDLTCFYDHKMVKINFQTNPQYFQTKQKYGCMRCGNWAKEYFIDQYCFTRLCENCIFYSKRVVKEQERPVILKCKENHMLFYIDEEVDIEAECCSCGKQKIIKLICNYCPTNDFYCCQCRPNKAQTCYFKHKLKYSQKQLERKCQICKNSLKMYYFCMKCHYYICSVCLNKLVKEKEEKNENQTILTTKTAFETILHIMGEQDEKII